MKELRAYMDFRDLPLGSRVVYRGRVGVKRRLGDVLRHGIDPDFPILHCGNNPVRHSPGRLVTLDNPRIYALPGRARVALIPNNPGVGPEE